MKTLVIKELRKHFGKTWALKNLNIELDPGEIFVLLGPNGAGKTTTLKLIAGLFHPTHGDIYIKGINLAKEPLKAKRMTGYIPDEPFIYNKLTGREFINFIAGIYDINKDQYESRMDALLGKLDIGEWIDDFSETYSHGMKQKVIMCQLFLHNPDLILIDEPLVGLDPKSSKSVREIFLELKAQSKTLFICTHTLSFAKEIASKIGIINKGELKFIGALSELSEISGKKDIEEIYLKLSEELPLEQEV
jgi:ABC-2 type transport system ATP-binding protein